MIVWHVVTERPMHAGQQIVFDEQHHSGVWQRVMELLPQVERIYRDPAAFMGTALPHHLSVALRELALEEIRRTEHPELPSRMACLYTSATMAEAQRWASFFRSLGRPVFGIVRLRADGRCFAGNADNCFQGTPDREENLRLARYYWEHPCPPDTGGICELLIDGTITVLSVEA